MNGYRRYGICTTEYCSAMRKKEILPFATAGMGLEGVMLGDNKAQKRHRSKNV